MLIRRPPLNSRSRAASGCAEAGVVLDEPLDLVDEVRRGVALPVGVGATPSGEATRGVVFGRRDLPELAILSSTALRRARRDVGVGDRVVVVRGLDQPGEHGRLTRSTLSIGLPKYVSAAASTP